MKLLKGGRRELLKMPLLKATALAFLSLSGLALAAPYPDKPIRLIVAFPPGGPVDTTARILSTQLADILKQSVIVENKVGAGGNIGAQYVANAAPDGYTFLVTSSAFAVNPTLYGAAAGYTPEKNFIPVVVATTQANVISVNENVPIKSIAELKALAAKENLSYSSPGNGTTPQLTCENLFKIIWKANVTSIPYKGAGPASFAVLSGETPVGCTAVAGVYQFAKQGKVRILAVSSEKRLASLPDVPTLAEQGYPQIKDYTWTTVFAPIKTPAAIVQKVNQAINQVIANPEMKDKFDQAGLLIVGGTSKQASDYITEEVKRWAQIVKETGAKAD
jgi:tripartite-type tricarboxylate transporter receptor subunit TctC